MKTFGILANLDKELTPVILPKLFEWLLSRKLVPIVPLELKKKIKEIPHGVQVVNREKLPEKCDLVISLGGDGTILNAARLVRKQEIPILGVNLGGLGFLAESAIEELTDRLEAILKNKYHIEERMMIEGGVTNQEEKYYALNDIVVIKGNWARVIKLETYLDDEYLNTYVADGLVVSTPTGSTAYALSTGGPIVIPTMNALVVSPINPHSLSVRPIVIPSERVVRVVIKSTDANILFSADGQTVKSLVEEDVIEIRRSDTKIKLVKFPGKGFFEVMRNKLHWGEDIRGLK